MVAGCSHEHANLVTGHAYTLLGIQELKKGGKVVQQLIKLRNPWGKENYTGPWNDNDTKWTADYKKQAGGPTAGGQSDTTSASTQFQ